MGNKGTQRKFLSTLHPNTIITANPDHNTHPNPQPSPSPTLPPPLALTLTNPSPDPSPSSNPWLGSELVLGSKMESNDMAKSSHDQNLGDLVQPNQHGWHGRTSSVQRFGLGLSQVEGDGMVRGRARGGKGSLRSANAWPWGRVPPHPRPQITLTGPPPHCLSQNPSPLSGKISCRSAHRRTSQCWSRQMHLVNGTGNSPSLGTPE